MNTHFKKTHTKYVALVYILGLILMMSNNFASAQDESVFVSEAVESQLEQFIEDAEKKRRFHRQVLIALPATLELMSKGRPSHPLAGKPAKANGELIYVEDWFEKVFGMPYLLHELNRPPMIIYFCRMAFDRSVPVDNDVVYVKCHGSGGLLHNSEIERG